MRHLALFGSRMLEGWVGRPHERGRVDASRSILRQVSASSRALACRTHRACP